ncbi:hypothetical protein MJ904_24195 [Massilia sp. MB5]|uniref:hypothetical protein n=1 Tax=unclassified Massilia TaxID=2609279 RepID=UPI00067C499D|nr:MULTISPECIES: hypothetical protein [unclassified Massilia]AKU20474.1 hypothetical protein ACZ75_02000 [Massilia sp. NR 4-1]UMR30077.1 hypothetical protein MJ904_24195 [Massilia sp. MB5]
MQSETFTSVGAESSASGVSWGAIFGGGAAAAALSFILLFLGLGLGLSSISPYSYNEAPIAGSTIGWVIFMQLAASAIGGYVAGRLRVKWAGIHGDEVHFRDTAHGLLAWAVATLLTAGLLAGSMRAALSGAIDSGAVIGNVASTAVAAEKPKPGTGQAFNAIDYYSDITLRSANGTPSSDAERAEITRIFSAALASGGLAPSDRTYLAQTIARRSALTQPDAERRVDEIYSRAASSTANAKAKAMQAADAARKTAAHSALWMFVALLAGAFVASLCATLGGRSRDNDRVVTRPAT